MAVWNPDLSITRKKDDALEFIFDNKKAFPQTVEFH